MGRPEKNMAMLLIDHLQRMPDTGKKGAIFELAVARFLECRGDYVRVMRWHEWHGRDEDVNGIDLVAIDPVGRLHGVQVKYRSHSIATAEVVSFVSSLTKYYLSNREPAPSLHGALFVTSKPTLDPRHQRTMQILSHQGIPLQVLTRQDLIADDSWVNEDLMTVAGCPVPTTKRKKRLLSSKPKLNVDVIEGLICAYRTKYDQYPSRHSGPVDGLANVTWLQIDNCFKKGNSGLPSAGSLKMFIAAKFGVRHPKMLPPLSEATILSIAHAHYAAFGYWPTGHTKERLQAQEDSWQAIASALNMGARGLDGGDSLGALLRRNGCVGVKIIGKKLSIEDIVMLARDHHASNGSWPTKKNTEPINGEAGLTWRSIDKALRERQARISGIEVFAAQAQGKTGGHTSLAALLYIHCAVESHAYKHHLEPETILAAADIFRRKNGRWPCQADKDVIQGLGSIQLTWSGLAQRLRHGYCGFPGGSSLHHFFRQYRPDDRDLQGYPEITYGGILKLIRSHKRRHGDYPKRNTGAVNGYPGLTWEIVDGRLRAGNCGFPKGSSLARVLEKEFGDAAPPNRGNREAMRLCVQDVTRWLTAFATANSRFPNRHDGAVVKGSWVTWQQLISALNMGRRGLPKCSLGSFARSQGIAKPARPDRPA